jgi:hypothetical protein
MLGTEATLRGPFLKGFQEIDNHTTFVGKDLSCGCILGGLVAFGRRRGLSGLSCRHKSLGSPLLYVASVDCWPDGGNGGASSA